MVPQDATQSDQSDHSAVAKSKTRRVGRVACNACRQRRARCDEQRPACLRCVRSGKECVFDTKDIYETRSMALRRENQSLRKDLAELKSSLEDRDAQALETVPSLTHDPSVESSHSSYSAPDHSPERQRQPASLIPPHGSAMEGVVPGTDTFPKSFVSPEAPQPSSHPSSDLYATGLDYEQHVATILHALTTTSDTESAMILTYLRQGTPWADLAAVLQTRLNTPLQPGTGLTEKELAGRQMSLDPCIPTPLHFPTHNDAVQAWLPGLVDPGPWMETSGEMMLQQAHPTASHEQFAANPRASGGAPHLDGDSNNCNRNSWAVPAWQDENL